MIKRDELTAYLNTYLSCDQFKDHAPNGLQVEGKEPIQFICTAVTASQQVIESAIHLNADALLVHHGYFWKGESPEIVGVKKNRLARLLQHDMNLLAYHLPLDCHVDVGNNACLGSLLEVESIRHHEVNGVKNLLWSGVLKKPQTLIAFSKSVKKKLKREPLTISGGSRPISRIAWCSGSAQDFIEAANALQVDAFLSGEVSERTYYLAKELGLHYLACGHHATERYGIQALGHHLVNRFDLSHQFIDSENPI